MSKQKEKKVKARKAWVIVALGEIISETYTTKKQAMNTSCGWGKVIPVIISPLPVRKGKSKK